jgi:hypothetical protein
MAIGSIGANRVPIGGPSTSAAALSAAAEARRAEQQAEDDKAALVRAERGSAADAPKPVRSSSATLGTLVDTYL